MFFVAYWTFTMLVVWYLGDIVPAAIATLYELLAKSLLGTITAYYIYPRVKRWFYYKRSAAQNKSIFITGCDSGFGFELAKKLDRLGYKVFAGCLFPDADSAKHLIETSSGLHVVGLDVTKQESVQQARDYVLNNLGNSELWAVVNNAGVIQGFDIGWGRIESFERCFAVNALGPVRVTRAFLPLLEKSRGRVVTVTSMTGKLSFPNNAPYGMSKFAAAAFVDCLRMETKRFGIKCISIEPEFFRTSLVSSILNDPEAVIKDSENLDMYGMKYVESVMRKARFYASDAACSNIALVLDDLYDAISLEQPDDVYRTCRNRAVRSLLDTGIAAPRPLQEFFFEKFGDFWQWPAMKAISFVKNML